VYFIFLQNLRFSQRWLLRVYLLGYNTHSYGLFFGPDDGRVPPSPGSNKIKTRNQHGSCSKKVGGIPTGCSALYPRKYKCSSSSAPCSQTRVILHYSVNIRDQVLYPKIFGYFCYRKERVNEELFNDAFSIRLK
jgi:hypothetical protein